MAPSADRSGNLIDPSVSCARGAILASEVEETLRQRHGHELLRERVARGGDDAVFNLTGLIFVGKLVDVAVMRKEVQGYYVMPANFRGLRLYELSK